MVRRSPVSRQTLHGIFIIRFGSMRCLVELLKFLTVFLFRSVFRRCYTFVFQASWFRTRNWQQLAGIDSGLYLACDRFTSWIRRNIISCGAVLRASHFSCSVFALPLGLTSFSLFQRRSSLGEFFLWLCGLVEPSILLRVRRSLKEVPPAECQDEVNKR